VAGYATAPVRVESTLAADGTYQLQEGFLSRIDTPDPRPARAYVSVREASEALGYSQDVVGAMVRTGALPAEQIHTYARRRIEVKVLLAYCKSSCHMSDERLFEIEAKLAEVTSRPESGQ
jgi:hypothetical protein